MRPHGLDPTRLLCSWNSPDKNTGMGYHALLQGIFLSQGLNPGLLHCRLFTIWENPGSPTKLPLTSHTNFILSRVPKAHQAPAQAALCSLNQQAHSYLSLCTHYLFTLPIIFFPQSYTHLVLGYYLSFCSIINQFFRTAFPDHVIQRTFPHLHPSFFITLPYFTVFTALFTLKLLFVILLFNCLPLREGKLQSTALACLVPWRQNSQHMGCSLCRTKKGDKRTFRTVKVMHSGSFHYSDSLSQF